VAHIFQARPAEPRQPHMSEPHASASDRRLAVLGDGDGDGNGDGNGDEHGRPVCSAGFRKARRQSLAICGKGVSALILNHTRPQTLPDT
jgi:hypothetical protein